MWGTFFRESPFSRCGDTKDTTGDAGDTRDVGDFLSRKSPTPPKNLLTGYSSKGLSRGILPTAKLWRIFSEDSRVCEHPLFASGKNPPEFSPVGGKFCPRQGRNPFDLKVKLTYRAHTLLNRTLTEREVFTFNLFEV